MLPAIFVLAVFGNDFLLDHAELTQRLEDIEVPSFGRVQPIALYRPELILTRQRNCIGGGWRVADVVVRG